MASEARCIAALPRLKEATSGVEGVVGVGVGEPENGQCVLRIYVDRIRPEHDQLPRVFALPGKKSPLLEVAVEIVPIGAVKPMRD